MLAETPHLLRLYKMRRHWMLASEEIAKNLGISPREIKNLNERLARALKRINAVLEEEMRRT
jgi:DNA-directed RNA polymerase specialized sigma24 family protein